jgi:transcriptional regulator of met regulon
MKIFEEYKKKWNGEYLEPYADVVKRLSVYQ